MTDGDATSKLINATDYLRSAAHNAYGAMYDSKNIDAIEYIAEAINDLHTAGQNLKIARLLLEMDFEIERGSQ